VFTGHVFFVTHACHVRVMHHRYSGKVHNQSRRSSTARVTASSIEETGSRLPTQGLPPKCCSMIRSAVRVARACVVSVGLGPPIPLASAELSATYNALTQRDAECSSSTEFDGSVPMRMVLWLWMTKGGLLMRWMLLAPSDWSDDDRLYCNECCM
jgi:hypothetical protein